MDDGCECSAEIYIHIIHRAMTHMYIPWLPIAYEVS